MSEAKSKVVIVCDVTYDPGKFSPTFSYTKEGQTNLVNVGILAEYLTRSSGIDKCGFYLDDARAYTVPQFLQQVSEGRVVSGTPTGAKPQGVENPIDTTGRAFTSGQILAALSEWLLTNDQPSRLMLADAFEDVGDVKVSELLREGGFPLYVAWGGEPEKSDLRIGNYNPEDLVQFYQFHSAGEREVFFNLATTDAEMLAHGTAEEVIAELMQYVPGFRRPEKKQDK